MPPIISAGDRVSALEFGALILFGVAAAAISAFVELGLKIPGHNIIRAIFPMALGLALVPRRGSASVMGAGGLAGGMLFSLVGFRGIGVGAITGLFLIGLLLDVALTGARNGRDIYFRLAAAGLIANLVAFAVRGTAKVMVGAPLVDWLPRAVVSYPICGILAGLISAAVWFRFADDRPPAGSEARA